MEITFEQYKLLYNLLENKMDELRPLTYSDEKAYEIHLDYAFTQIAINAKIMEFERERSRLEL